jgi:hypothetical protein
VTAIRVMRCDGQVVPACDGVAALASAKRPHAAERTVQNTPTRALQSPEQSLLMAELRALRVCTIMRCPEYLK